MTCSIANSLRASWFFLDLKSFVEGALANKFFSLSLHETVCLEKLILRLSLTTFAITVAAANLFFLDDKVIHQSVFEVVFLGLPGDFLLHQDPVSLNFFKMPRITLLDFLTMLAISPIER